MSDVKSVMRSLEWIAHAVAEANDVRVYDWDGQTVRLAWEEDGYLINFYIYKPFAQVTCFIAAHSNGKTVLDEFARAIDALKRKAAVERE